MKPISIRILPLLLFAVLALASCGDGMSDEDRIKTIVRDAAASAEAKDVSGVMKHLSKDFTGGQQDVDYDSIKGLLVYDIMRPGKVRVIITKLDVEVKKSGAGRTGLASVSFVAVRGRPKAGSKELLPDSIGGFRASLVFNLEGDEWKVVHGEWVDVGPGAL
jgi:ketosteroid isomerase-like protein